MSDGTSKLGINQDRDSGSIWSVIIPIGIDRQVYIDQCYLTDTVSIIIFI